MRRLHRVLHYRKTSLPLDTQTKTHAQQLTRIVKEYWTEPGIITGPFVMATNSARTVLKDETFVNYEEDATLRDRFMARMIHASRGESYKISEDAVSELAGEEYTYTEDDNERLAIIHRKMVSAASASLKDPDISLERFMNGQQIRQEVNKMTENSDTVQKTIQVAGEFLKAIENGFDPDDEDDDDEDKEHQDPASDDEANSTKGSGGSPASRIKDLWMSITSSGSSTSSGSKRSKEGESGGIDVTKGKS